MPTAVIIGLCAWGSIVFLVLAVCRQAARGDEALIAPAVGRHRVAHQLRPASGSTNSRAAARAQGVAAHRARGRSRPARLS